MSPSNYNTVRLSRNEARKLIAKIVKEHPENIRFSSHSNKELAADGLFHVDVLNVLQSADSRIHSEGELENGSYRYRLETRLIMVVIAFSPEGDGLTVVTAWNKRRRK